jgi:hypothetical protein
MWIVHTSHSLDHHPGLSCKSLAQQHACPVPASLTAFRGRSTLHAAGTSCMFGYHSIHLQPWHAHKWRIRDFETHWILRSTLH